MYKLKFLFFNCNNVCLGVLARSGSWNTILEDQGLEFGAPISNASILSGYLLQESSMPPPWQEPKCLQEFQIQNVF